MGDGLLRWIATVPALLVEEAVLPITDALALLLKTSWLHAARGTFRLSVPFRGFVCLSFLPLLQSRFLHLCRKFSNQDAVILPRWSSVFKIIFPFLGLLHFHMDFKISFSVSGGIKVR